MTSTRDLDVAGHRYAYIEAGSGPLVLFGHGTFGGKELFLPQVEALASQFHCVAVDWPGHGGSPADPAGWNVSMLVDAVPGLIRALGHRSAALAGVSQGGAVFMRVALAHPEYVDALVIMCAGPGAPPAATVDTLRTFADLLRDEWDDVARAEIVDRFTSATFHAAGFAEADPEGARREREVMLGHPRETLGLLPDVPASYESVAGELHRIACPTLVVWGDQDPRLQVGEEMVAVIPRAELVVIAGAGHHVNVDAPARTTAAIGDFLSGLPLPEASA